MEIYMQKIGLIRDDINPKNMDLIGLFEEFNSENVSQIKFYHACNVLMDMSSITCESVHILSKSVYSNLRWVASATSKLETSSCMVFEADCTTASSNKLISSDR